MMESKVVYSRNGITLIHGDSTKILPLNKEVALTVTSPPYFMGKEGDIYKTFEEYREAMRTVMRGCFDCMIDGGIIVWDILAHSGLNLPAYAAQDLEEVGFSFWRKITWKKLESQGKGFAHTEMRPVTLNYIPNCITEDLLIYSKGEKRRRDERYQLNIVLARRFKTDVWNMKPVIKIRADGTNVEDHDSPFPLDLPMACIEFFTLPDEIVLDPFVGTGTTLKACALANPPRRGIGIEILKRHVIRTIRNLRSGTNTLWAYAAEQERRRLIEQGAFL